MENNITPGATTPNPLKPIPWLKSGAAKGSLVIVGIIGVILIVLFSRQIGDLLSWLASRAAVEVKDITLTFDQGGFSNSGYTAERWDAVSNSWVNDIDSFTVDNTNRLILNPH